MEKSQISVILNIILVILEIIALISAMNLALFDLRYYTLDANLFALISALLFLTLRKRIPNIVNIFKYSSTLSLLITVLVVIFVLCPMGDHSFNFLFLDAPNLYFHVLCPLTALISFIFFEKNELENTVKNNLMGIAFTFVYGVVIIALNLAKVVTGPYKFLMIYNQPVSISLMWIVVIFAFAFVLSRLLLMMKDLLTIFDV